LVIYLTRESPQAEVAALARVRPDIRRRRVLTNAATSRSRHGTTIIEFVVACSLLTALILLVVPSAVRIGRAQRIVRHERIALDELTNQLDRLAQLPLSQIKQEITSLTPSEFALAGLQSPRLSGAIQESEEGHRLVLKITWDSSGGSEVSRTMATWTFPRPANKSIEEGSAS